MNAFTAGPWEAVMSEDREHMSWVRDPSMPQGADSIALVGASDLDEEQANVTLIAAAPDLYEALRRVDHTLSVHGKVDADTPLHEFVSSALARATV